MAEDGRIQQLEDEVKLLKNEIRHVLTDVEEYILNARNPFSAAVAVDVPNLGIVINQPVQQEPSAAPPAREQVPPKGETGGESVTLTSESLRSEQDGGERAEGVNPAVDAAQEAETPGPNPEDGASPASRQDGNLPSAQGSDAARATQVASGPSFTETNQIRQMPPDPGDSVDSMANALDLETIFALSQWVRSATEKIGAKRLNILLEICYLARYLSEQSREVILGLIRLSAPHKRGPEAQVPMKTCMAIIAQLCNILQQEHNLSSTVLSLIVDLAEE